jgi:hypothetical protein
VIGLLLGTILFGTFFLLSLYQQDVRTMSTTRTNNLPASGVARPISLTDGFKLAFWVGVGFAVIALAAAFVALKREDLKPQAQPVESPREEADDEQVAA